MGPAGARGGRYSPANPPSEPARGPPRTDLFPVLPVVVRAVEVDELVRRPPGLETLVRDAGRRPQERLVRLVEVEEHILDLPVAQGAREPRVPGVDVGIAHLGGDGPLAAGDPLERGGQLAMPAHHVGHDLLYAPPAQPDLGQVRLV